MFKRVIGTLGAVLALAGVAILRRRRKLAYVEADLRSAMLYVPMSISSKSRLRVARALTDKASLASKAPRSVEVRHEVAPGTAGGPDVPLLVYEPRGRERPSGAFLWIHGGGLVMGVPAQDNRTCGRFADRLGIVVVSVDYRLAPEHPFPAGLDDCYRALAWLHDHAEDLGVDRERIAVGGGSAGGGLAACLAQMAHDRGGPGICFQLLQYPMLDDRTPLDPDRDGLVWTAASNRYAWTAYLGHEPSETEARAYAAAARREDLSGLAPAWIGVGKIDLFHDECVEYARRLDAAGVECELHVVSGMYHGADQMAPKAGVSRDFTERMVKALGDATSSHQPAPASDL